MVQQQQASSPEDLEKAWLDAGQGLSNLNEFTGTVKEAYFATESDEYESAPRKDEGALIVLVFDIDTAIDPDDFSFDEAKIRMKVGKAENFNIIDNGTKIVAKKGGFAGSKYSRWIKQALEVVNIPLRDRGILPEVAAAWVGLKLHCKQHEEALKKPFTTPDGKEILTTRTWLIEGWLQDRMPPLA